MKAIALISGGLDSTLAAKIIKDLGIDLVALNTVSPFCLCNRKDKDGSCRYEARKVTEGLNIKLISEDVTLDIIEIVKKPKHGFGSNMNPCIDCRILLFKKAKEAMKKEGASFVVTGEVLDQRPMSQKLKTMALIEKESGLEGLVLRPLSAKALSPTIPQKNGWISSEKLYSIAGRTRGQQFALASEFGINDYPCPSGGCLLTDKEFSLRLKDLMQHEGLNLADIHLLKVGRHFRLDDKIRLVVGRNESENNRISALKNVGDFFFMPQEEIAGPSAILRGIIKDSSILELASRIIARYCDKIVSNAEIICRKSDLEEYKFIVLPLEENKIISYRIN